MGRRRASRSKKKSPAQLDREIAASLNRLTTREAAAQQRRHHATRHVSADAWDVAMDAILEHDPERAAKIVRKIRDEHGVLVNATQDFADALHAAHQRVRDEFFEIVEAPEHGPKHLVHEGAKIPISSEPRTIKSFELKRAYVLRRNGQLYVIDSHDRGRVAHPATVL